MKIVIRWKTSDVAPFVDIVRAKADEERQALGFLPGPAYHEAADQGKLLVAIASRLGSEIYAGHLLFGGVYPKGRIFQVFVDPEFRRQGIGQQLVRAAVRKVQAAFYLSITIRVARDLSAANAFWERMGFGLVRTKPGGVSRGRSINVRARDLDTPSLFNLMRAPEVRSESDLRLVERLSARAPVYVIDLNVLFDVVKRRMRADEAGRVIRAGLDNLVRLAVTEEFINELRRSSKPAPTDPILELALRLPRLQYPPQATIAENLIVLGRLIFPERASHVRLSPQDQSDLLHLATAIYHNAAGFVTSEKAILRARTQLQSGYGIDVIGVAEFARAVEPRSQECPRTVHALRGGAEVRASELDETDESATSDFLDQMFVPQQLADDAMAAGDLGAGRRRILVNCGEEIVAYASWNACHAPHNTTDVFICADEDHQAAEAVVDHLIDRICNDVSRTAPAVIRLRELPGHVITRRVAIVHGFRPVDKHALQGGNLQKICVGSPVDDANWGTTRLRLKTLAGITLPKTLPQIKDPRDMVRVGSPSGSIIDIPLKDLENLLSPVLFLFPSRDGVIVPIRRVFADDLFGASPQLSLLASPEAVLLRERMYFSSPKTLSLLTEGTPLVFYESSRKGGRSSAIAAARVVDSHLMFKRDVAPSVRRRGVVEESTLERLSTSNTVAATTFDNIMVFKCPVPLRRLREIGCVDRANFVTARPVSARKLAQILKEGQAID